MATDEETGGHLEHNFDFADEELAADVHDLEKKLRKYVHFIHEKHLPVCGRLGKGGFGEVYECRWVYQGEPVAVKFVSLVGKKDKVCFINEVKRMAIVRHGSFPQLFGFSVQESDGVLQGAIIMEKLDAPLKQFLQQKPTWFERITVLRDCAKFLSYLHDVCGWAHGDIYPGNIMVKFGKRVEGKIVDLGLSRYVVLHTLTSLLPSLN